MSDLELSSPSLSPSRVYFVLLTSQTQHCAHPLPYIPPSPNLLLQIELLCNHWLFYPNCSESKTHFYTSFFLTFVVESNTSIWKCILYIRFRCDPIHIFYGHHLSWVVVSSCARCYSDLPFTLLSSGLQLLLYSIRHWVYHFIMAFTLSNNLHGSPLLLSAG